MEHNDSMKEGDILVLLPYETARPPDDAAAAKTRAALLTPLTLLADVVVSPTIFLIYVLNGMG